MTTITVHPDEANRLYDQLRRRGITDPATGDEFTVVQCDAALVYAVIAVSDREGFNANTLPVTDEIWRMLLEDVAAHLEIEYDEIIEVAP